MDRNAKRNRRLAELSKHSFSKFREFEQEEDGIIDARELFRAKKKYDQWWREALDRFNKLNGSKKDEEWMFMLNIQN